MCEISDRWYGQQTELARDLGNQGKHDKAGEIFSQLLKNCGGPRAGEILHNRGVNLQGAKEFTEASRVLRAALVLREEAGDEVGAAFTAFQIPMCHLVAGESKEDLRVAFERAREAIEDAIKKPGLDSSTLANLKQNLAFCLQIGDKPQAH